MNFLFVTTYDLKMNSSASLRNSSLINGLINVGMQVDLLTSESIEEHARFDESFNLCENNLGEKYYIKYNNKLKSFISTKNEFKTNNTLKNNVKLFLKKIYKKFSVIDPGKMNVKNVDELRIDLSKYDCIISSSDPKSSHLIVKRLLNNCKQIKKPIWIQYWGDPLALDITHQSLIPFFYLKKIEYDILKNADKIIYVSPLTLEEQKNEYPKLKEKMFFLPIPYYKERIYKNNNKIKEKYCVSYIGSYHSKYRNILPLYNSFNNTKNLKLSIVGDSDLSLHSKENIEVIPRLSLKETEKYEEDADLLIVLLNKKGTQIPGKIYHYAGTNKPILIILDGDRKEEIKEYLSLFNRFYFCENNEKDILKTIWKIKNTKKEWLPSPYLRSEQIAKQLVKIIDGKEPIK